MSGARVGCPGCGYDLAGVAGAETVRCPECGKDWPVPVPVGPTRGARVGRTVAAILAPAALWALVLYWALEVAWHRGNVGLLLLIAGAGALIGSGAAAWLLMRGIRGDATARQVVNVAFGLAAAVGLVVALLAWMMSRLPPL